MQLVPCRGQRTGLSASSEAVRHSHEHVVGIEVHLDTGPPRSIRARRWRGAEAELRAEVGEPILSKHEEILVELPRYAGARLHADGRVGVRLLVRWSEIGGVLGGRDEGRH